MAEIENAPPTLDTSIYRDPVDRMAAIDGLRGVFSIYVLVFHEFGTFFENGSTPNQFLGFSFATMGPFFSLSAFLLYGSLRRRAPVEKAWRRNFYRRRFFRIIPLWWAFLLLDRFLGPRPMSIGTHFLNMSFLFGFVSFNEIYTPTQVAWSLFVEETFYLILPWIYSSLGRLRNIIVLLGLTYFISSVWLSHAESWGIPSRNCFIGRSPLAFFQMFAIGILLREAYAKTNLSSWLEANKGPGWVTWLDVFGIGCFFSPLAHIPIPQELATPLLILVAFTKGTLLGRLVRLAPFRWLGVRCYCIYLMQGFDWFPAVFLKKFCS